MELVGGSLLYLCRVALLYAKVAIGFIGGNVNTAVADYHLAVL